MFGLNTKYEIKTKNGYEDFLGIQVLENRKTVCFILEDGSSLDCTYDHKINTPFGFVEAMKLYEGDVVETEKGYKEIVRVIANLNPEKVYDVIDAGIDKSYYTNGILSHNCEFLGSSNTLISGAKLQQLMATMEDPIARIEKLRIFEHAKENHTYVLTADVSEGLGLDYSTFSIIDVTQIPYRVVATFRDNMIKPILFPTILVSTAKRYNDAFILVEINSIGLQVADMIHYDLAYENLIKIQSKGKQGQQWTPGFAKKLAFGVKTSTQTKQIGCTNLKSLIESDKLLVTDEMTIKELTNFTANKKTYKAEEGNNDDLVMTLVNFSWLMAQKFFRETVSNDMRKVLQEEQLNIIDNDIVPFGAIDNGVDDPFNDNRDVNGDLWVEDRSRKYVFDNFDWSYGQASKF